MPTSIRDFPNRCLEQGQNCDQYTNIIQLLRATFDEPQVNLNRLMDLLNRKMSIRINNNQTIQFGELMNLEITNNSVNFSNTNSLQEICNTVIRSLNLGDRIQCENNVNFDTLSSIYSSNSRALRNAEFIFNPGWNNERYQVLVNRLRGLRTRVFENSQQNVPNWDISMLTVILDRAGLIDDRYRNELPSVENWHYPLLREVIGRDRNNNYVMPLCLWKGDVFVFIVALSEASR